MGSQFRHSICNEIYQGWKFADACRSMKKIGYSGIEIAHFTLAEEPAAITPEQRREYRAVMAAEGLEFVGLHWVMVAPKGLHVTTPDAALRARSWRHISDLIDLSADLGDKSVMVFGSPYQRSTTGGITREEATKNFIAGVASVAPHAEERGVTILVEALPRAQSEIICRLAEAAEVVRQVGSPAVQTMFDAHNTADESDPADALIDRYIGMIRHVHVNEMDGRHPGTGDYDFRPMYGALSRHNYRGWVSLEVFDFAPGSEKIAEESLRHLKANGGGVAR
jgi:D-psicose/D-tagatose/L-ribulose 3-epimerase